jgi:hypothetical protein
VKENYEESKARSAKATGENLEVVWAEFSTISWAVLM